MGKIYSLFGSRGGMEDISVPQNSAKNNLKIGTVLFFKGYGDDSYVIVKNLGISENFPQYGTTYEAINLRTGQVLQKQALSLKPISQKQDDRIAVYITDEVKSGDEVLDAIDFSEKAKIKSAKEKEMKETARAEYVEKIKSEYPYLTQVKDSKKSTVATGAANLKKELQRAFPGKKVYAKSNLYSMGCSIKAKVEGAGWNTPELEQARKIANKYQYGNFDGMEDIYNYTDSPFSEVFGGAKYVFVNY